MCIGGSRATAEENTPVPDARVWNEADQERTVSEVLKAQGDGPVIVLPIYTRCGASCPVLTKKLEKATAGIASGLAYRVVVFSFDPSETSESLRSFRKQEEVPASWATVRAEEKEIRRFFDFFRYTVMTEGGVLTHPNKIFLLDRQLRWRQTLTGVEWNPEELQKELERTESTGLVAWAAMNPAKVAVLGICGILGSFALYLGWLIFRKPGEDSAAV